MAQSRKQLQIQCTRDCLQQFDSHSPSKETSHQPCPPVGPCLLLCFWHVSHLSSFHQPPSTFFPRPHSLFLGHPVKIQISFILLFGVTDLFVSSWPTQAKPRELTFLNQKGPSRYLPQQNNKLSSNKLCDTPEARKATFSFCFQQQFFLLGK